MISIKENSNYLAKIFKIKDIRKHENADRLQCLNVDFQNVITGLDAKDGGIYIFFPVGSQVDPELLSFLDAFQDEERNRNKVKGYFSNSGVVKAANLRSEKSEGYVVPISKIEEFYKVSGLEKFENQYFDTIGNVRVCWKYINRHIQQSSSSNKKTRKATKECSRLIENQFHLHDDTEQIGRNIDKFSLDDEISILSKWHGTNFSMGRVRVKKSLSFLNRVFKFLGGNVVEEEYQGCEFLPVYSSRNVIKNRTFSNNNSSGYYKFDFWTEIAKRYGDKLPKNFSVYGEIVGQSPDGKWIQKMKNKGYDYGLKENTFDLFVFRVTFTNFDGSVYELGTSGSEQFCDKHGFKFVPIFFQGTVQEFLGNENLSDDGDWRDKFVNKIKKMYNEKDCEFCKNKLPEEGVVIIKQRLDKFDAYKQKSHRFLKAEVDEIEESKDEILD